MRSSVTAQKMFVPRALSTLRAAVAGICLSSPMAFTSYAMADDELSLEPFPSQAHTPDNSTGQQWLIPSAIFGAGALSLVFAGFRYRHYLQAHQQLSLHQQQLKHLIGGSGDELWSWQLEGVLQRSQCWEWFNFPLDGVRNDCTGGAIVHPRDLPRLKTELRRTLEGEQEKFQVTYRVRDDNAKWRWLLDRGCVVETDPSGNPSTLAGAITDVSHLMQNEEQQRLFARTLETISDAVVILDKQFRVAEINQAFTRITGFDKEQVIGWRFFFSRYPEQFSEQMRKTLDATGRWFGELEEKRSDGSIFQMELTLDAIADETGDFSHFVGVFSDITERKDTEKELRKLANSDTLTSLPNRSLFTANHQHMVRKKVKHALLVLDLDDFKKINDSLGHHVGDDLLCELATRLQKRCGPQETLYRLGGDEFAILIEGDNHIAGITKLAEEIQATMQEPLHLVNNEIFVTASIGIVLYPLDGITPEDLLKKADTAMYYAKNTGPNLYQFFSESMNEQAVKRLAMEALLRRALKEDLIEVHYQPQYSITSQSMIGMESLVRLRNPDSGSLMFPGEFMPLAEESGLIVDIGERVLEKACEAVKKWRSQGLFNGRVAVNLSAKQVQLEDFGKRLANVLEKTGLSARALELEITEGSVMDSPGMAIASMQAVRQLGIQLALDDFGTGYSSLAYLKQFPITTLKIDRTFVKDLECSLEDRQMANAVVTIAHNLGLEVVAEGVETELQLKLLTAMNCEVYQGYLFSKPLSESDMHNLLTDLHRDPNSRGWRTLSAMELAD